MNVLGNTDLLGAYIILNTIHVHAVALILVRILDNSLPSHFLLTCTVVCKPRIGTLGCLQVSQNFWYVTTFHVNKMGHMLTKCNRFFTLTGVAMFYL